MSLSLSAARDAVVLTILTAWQAGGAPSASVPMHYDNVKADKPGEDGTTTNAGPWARTTVRTTDSPQSTMGKRRRYLTEGTVTVQIFTAVGDGHALGDTLAQVVLDALRAVSGSPDTLWFFDATANEIGVDGPWFQINVGAIFRYQETA